ncbi:ATP-dependent dna helicase [Phytophthora cinnamomi]|uniref:ATP-dependent dna helicase n=1 Tax=Phytophthora cinnamomi TaxID=4785 RepID=UPI003559FBB1|nr:atpdependent dna helicase [Phytophthora cinnamomi]
MQQQRRQTGRSGDGGAPHRSRSLVNPYATSYQQQQPQSSFLQYSMPVDSPSIRSFNQPQQPPPHMPGRYWQAPTGVEASTLSSGKQSRHAGSLDFDEFGDILDTNSARSGGDAAAAGAPSEAASEMSMGSFDAHSFNDGMAGSTGGSGVDAAGFQSAPLTTGSPAPDAEENKAPTRVIPASADPHMMALVDAAYMPFSNSSSEPDLTTEKLSKDNSERCQFHDCPNRARVSQSYGNFCNRHVIVAPCGFPGCRDKAMERAAINLSYAAGLCVEHTKESQNLISSQGRTGFVYPKQEIASYYSSRPNEPSHVDRYCPH